MFVLCTSFQSLKQTFVSLFVLHFQNLARSPVATVQCQAQYTVRILSFSVILVSKLLLSIFGAIRFFKPGKTLLSAAKSLLARLGVCLQKKVIGTF